MNIHPCCKRGYPNSQVAQQFCDRTRGEDRLRAGAKCVNPWEWGDYGISTAKYGWDLTTSTQDLIEISPLSLWLQVKTPIRFMNFDGFPRKITRSSPDFPKKNIWSLHIFAAKNRCFAPQHRAVEASSSAAWRLSSRRPWRPSRTSAAGRRSWWPRLDGTWMRNETCRWGMMWVKPW